MHKVLYIISNGDSLRSDLVLPAAGADQETSVVLIEAGVTLTDVPSSHVFALAEDVAARNVTPAFPTVSYEEMLRLMFEADSVVAL